MPEANCAIRYSSKAIIFAKRSLIRPGGHWWAVKAYPIFSDSHFSLKSFIQGPRVSLNQEFWQNVAFMFVYVYSGNFILNTMRPNFLWINFGIFIFPLFEEEYFELWIRPKLYFCWLLVQLYWHATGNQVLFHFKLGDGKFANTIVFNSSLYLRVGSICNLW